MKNKIMKNTLLTVLILIVFACPVFALPPDPDNAALLYYQAFCVYEKPDDTMSDMVYDLAKGTIEPNPTITKYIERCRPAIELAAVASELPNCDWGLKYSDGFDMQAAHLGQVRILTHIIIADARVALAQGDCDLAIQRCLTARRVGLHVVQDPTAISFLVEKAIEKVTNKCIQDILSFDGMGPQELQYLKSQLDELDSKLEPIEFFLDTEREVFETYMTREKFNEVLFNKDLVVIEASLLKIAQERFLSADEQFFVKNRDYWQNYFAAVKAALDMPYPQAFAKLKEIEEKVKKDVIENPDATATAILVAPFARICSQDIEAKTFSNAVRAALDIYLIKAKAGTLPDTLPINLPGDLFSGKSFLYEKTDNGFVLRCQGKDLSKDKIYEYEFRIKD